jgi:opacity protein-like surface antigen
MKNAWRRESLRKSVLLLFAMTMMAIAGSAVAQAQTATADAQTPFQFQLAQAFGSRGLGVEGYVHNGSRGASRIFGCEPTPLARAGR